ncbi:MAG TPA: GxxExxY protein [Armatimonadota bacterium]|nr:GxxExxY protein [Armatimonadota bacterium]
MLYEDVTGRIIAAAMKVHATLGNGFQEVIYQRALELELPHHSLVFEREKEMPIYYRNQLIGTRRVDFFVESLIMVEFKTISQLDDVHLAQARNYLEAYQVELGLLLNFGTTSLDVKRVYHNKLIQARSRSNRRIAL